MTTKRTRGRSSKVAQLPDHIRMELNSLLSDRSLTQESIRGLINQLIDDAGLPASMRLSVGGLNRYSVQMEQNGAKIREMNEIAEMWKDQLGVESSGETSRLLIQIVRNLAFEVSMKLSTGDGSVEPKGLKELATAIEKLEKAATESNKREQEIRRQFAAEAADAVQEELLGQDGMSEELERRIRRILLGKA